MHRKDLYSNEDLVMEIEIEEMKMRQLQGENFNITEWSNELEFGYRIQNLFDIFSIIYAEKGSKLYDVFDVFENVDARRVDAFSDPVKKVRRTHSISITSTWFPVDIKININQLSNYED